MCGFLAEESSQLQGPVTSSVVEQEGDGVTENLPKQPASQVPQVLGPHLLNGVASRELTEDGIYPVTKAAQIGAPLGGGISLFVPVGCEELDAHASRQLLLRIGRVVVAVPDEQPAGGLDEFWYDGKLVGVSRGHREAGDDTRPANPHVHPEAVEGLPEEGVLAESGFSSEAPAAVGAGEQARRQGHRVHEREGRVVRGAREKLLPETLLNLLGFFRLPGEGGSM
jgi:hypothetical protein